MNLSSIVDSFYFLGWKEIVMLVIGFVLIGLAIIKEYEPTLLLPIGFGCVLANLGMSSYQTVEINGLQQPGFMKVLYDAGGLYAGIERLLPLADILIPSAEYALGFTQKATLEDAARDLNARFHPEIVVITNGAEGGILFDGAQIRSYPAFKVEVADSNGAGDVFHGAFAFAVTRGWDYFKCCVFSSAVSALKCTKVGARSGVPFYTEVEDFLRKNY